MVKICDEYCHNCIYYEPYTRSFGYLFATDYLRKCPAGTGCPKKEIMRKRKDKKQLIICDKYDPKMKLYLEHKSDYEIAKILNITRAAVQGWRRRRGLKSNYIKPEGEEQ